MGRLVAINKYHSVYSDDSLQDEEQYHDGREQDHDQQELSERRLLLEGLRPEVYLSLLLIVPLLQKGQLIFLFHVHLLQQFQRVAVFLEVGRQVWVRGTLNCAD